MSAEGQIKAFIDRILRLKEEQDVIGDDIRDIYAEAKAMGFDKTAMGNVVAHLRKVAKKGSETVAEQGAIFDIYLAAYEGHAPAPARVRENIEKFDPLTGEIFEDAPRADGGLDIVTRQTEIATNEGGANPDSADVAQGSIPDLEPSGPEAERATNSPETATGPKVLDGRSGDEPESRHQIVVSRDGAGQNLTGNPFTAKPPSPLRPHCQQPEACGGYGRNHCHTCAKAMREREPAEELA